MLANFLGVIFVVGKWKETPSALTLTNKNVRMQCKILFCMAEFSEISEFSK